MPSYARYALLIIKLCVALAIGLVVWVKITEKVSIFFPRKGIQNTPESVGLEYQPITLRTSDNVSISGWFIPASDASITVLFLHGNAGSMSDRLQKLSLLHSLGVNILIIDYRGYGLSAGKPSVHGVHLDALAAYTYITQNRLCPPQSLVLYGESLGGAIAAELAQHVPVGGIIAEITLPSIRAIAKKICPFIPSWLITDAFNAQRALSNSSVPKLLMHSKNDEVVPFALAQELYAAAANPKTQCVLHGSHNAAYLDSRTEYLLALKKFFSELSL